MRCFLISFARRVVWVVVILASMTFAQETAWEHDDADDTACQPRLVWHGQASYSLRASPSRGPGVPGHCGIYHWLQSNSILIGAASPSCDAELVDLLKIFADRVHRSCADAPTLPTRGPPVLA